jgi:hydroxypyruvate isomerase
MPRFAANLTMLFTEHPFLDRFERAAKAGFKAVEFLFPYAWPAEEIKARLTPTPEARAAQPARRRLGRRRARHRLPARPGGRVPRRRGRAIAYAKQLGVPQLNCLAGKAPAGVPDAHAAPDLRGQPALCRQAELKAAGLKLLIEPINTFDIPGFYLNRTAQAISSWTRWAPTTRSCSTTSTTRSAWKASWPRR